jgi:23S rRNA pseudouridine2605 synthase
MKSNTRNIKIKDVELVRLNKFIADSGLCSRRKADDLIANGAVKVNGNLITALATKVGPTDFITVNGDPIKAFKHFTYILLNKPKDTISTTSDERSRKTVLDIVKSTSRIYPIGRLDRNTTGILLLTNDGEMSNRLTHPRYQIERIYVAGLDRPLHEKDALTISKGLELEDFSSAPCELFIDPKDNTKVTVILREGKHHEVKRIFESFGYEVQKLDRKSFAGLTTRGLKRGEHRHLTKTEIDKLKKITNIDK